MTSPLLGKGVVGDKVYGIRKQEAPGVRQGDGGGEEWQDRECSIQMTNEVVRRTENAGLLL